MNTDLPFVYIFIFSLQRVIQSIIQEGTIERNVKLFINIKVDVLKDLQYTRVLSCLFIKKCVYSSYVKKSMDEKVN